MRRQGRLDTGEVLAKNRYTHCFGLAPELSPASLVLAVFLSKSCHLPSVDGPGLAAGLAAVPQNEQTSSS